MDRDASTTPGLAPDTAYKVTAAAAHAPAGARWRDQYSTRHAIRRLDPAQYPGTTFPSRVRIYVRGAPAYAHLLQWWSRQARRTLSLTLRGCDWVDALAKAREIELSLNDQGHFEQPVRRRLRFTELLDGYRAHLARRADAGEISVATARRYAPDLDRFGSFVARPEILARYPGPASIDSAFALEFVTHLKRDDGVDGNARGADRHAADAVVDRVEAMLRWAADPRGGRLLPPTFVSPFAGRPRRRHDRGPLLAEPDITIAMAAEFLEACDDYALRLFAPIIVYGLRAAEPCLMMYEHIIDGKWITVSNLPGLDYTTKGKINKAFPVSPPLAEVAFTPAGTMAKGLIFLRRKVMAKPAAAPLLGLGLNDLVDEYARRRRSANPAGAAALLSLRRQVLREAGGLDYDDIYDEFRAVRQALAWPVEATVKDFRHLFATTMENAGLSERYQKFFMGHSQGGDAINCYRHMNQLDANFQRLIEAYQPILEVLRRRSQPKMLSQAGAAPAPDINLAAT